MKEDAKLSFADYFKIMVTAKSANQTPTTLITRHDDDTLTYSEATVALEALFNDLTNYVNSSNELTVRTIVFMWDQLFQYGVVDEKDSEELTKMLEEIQRDEN
ncbi:hypothetical protein GPK34_00600 [Secundilactobacillus kimchicus]|uniref:hypothetical protein n=1 Tax=Secundilactobacillus kimchicus TaxID=528209 RepID=UPI001C02310A|nr:hypothetical protein [Secundilactobacillus kimchicus]MBT9670537.1 hypothetical protein [Secundilactobacillus kimchicus]